jgi:dienelactone hydrolase
MPSKIRNQKSGVGEFAIAIESTVTDWLFARPHVLSAARVNLCWAAEMLCLTMRMRSVVAAGTALLVVGWSVLAATDPAVNGPFPATRHTIAIPGTEGATLITDLYFPGTHGLVSVGAGRCPVIVLGHGFAQTKDEYVNQGLHLATRGYLVLIPNSTAVADWSRFADDLRKCLDWIEAQDVDSNSIFFGRVRTNCAGATGHSAGGLSAILAATRDVRIRALSPMDPVDSDGLGVAALPSVPAPVAITYSEPSLCNANGSALTLYNAACAPKRGMLIVGANHSDPEDPASLLIEVVCGAADSERQMLYRRYMTGWFEYYLRGDAAYGPWVFDQPGGQLASDLASNKVTYTAR